MQMLLIIISAHNKLFQVITKIKQYVDSQKN